MEISLETTQDVNTTNQNIELLGIPYGLNGNTTQQTHIFSLDIPESTLRNTLENLISLENVNSLRNYFLERFSNNTGSTNPINEILPYNPDWEQDYENGENSDENGENSDENGENNDENGENNDENGENTVSNVKLNAIGDGEETVHNTDENHQIGGNSESNDHIGGNSGGNDDSVSTITQTSIGFKSVNTNNSEGDSKFIYSLIEIIKDIWENFPSSHISDLDNENKFYVNEVFWCYTNKQFQNENDHGSDYSTFRFFNPLYFPKIFQLVFPNNEIPLFEEEENILLASESQDDYDYKISEHNIHFIPFMKDHNEYNHIPLFIYRTYDQTKKEEIEKRRNEKTKLVYGKRSRINNQSNSQNGQPKRKEAKLTSNKLNDPVSKLQTNQENFQKNNNNNLKNNVEKMNQITHQMNQNL